MLVVDLGKWMNKILIDWGIDAKVPIVLMKQLLLY